MGYRGEAIGMGSVTPGLLTISGGYRYRRDPEWYPNHPRYREPGARRPPQGGDPRSSTAERQRRMARFAELRAGGLTPAEAGKRLGIQPKTARDYERALRDAREAAGA